MKHYLIIFALLLAGQAWGQVPDVIPDEYARKYKRIERRTDKLIRKEAPDVILDPIESLPIEPEFYAMDAGNWGPTYLGVNQRIDEIRSRAKRGVVVFIFDTGGCYDHPLLSGVAWNDLGRVFTGESDCADGHGHSTHVAGIIAANSQDQPLGIARMLPEIQLVPVKVLNNSGSGSYSWITEGTKYANQQAKKLIAEGYFIIYNYSLGGGSDYQPLEDAFKEAESLGVLINCAANGNTGNTPIQYPGASPYTIGVAALAQSGAGVERAPYSSYGPETWAAAPGSSILSTWPGGGLRILSGTSMATPHQAGLFAILASVYPEATAEELKAHFIEYATDLGSPGRDDYYGYGAGVVDGLLDNPPGQGPKPPTCDDGKQNGNETGIDCGGDCPPCEPEGPPEYRKRKFELALEGSWNLGWWQTLPAGLDSPQMYDLDATALISPAGLTQINIRRMVYDVNSESTFEWETDALKANAAEFFRNRALGTQAGWDIRDAGRWVLYFLDYFAANQADGYIYQDIEPVEVIFDWEGYRVEIRDGLISYKPKK